MIKQWLINRRKKQSTKVPRKVYLKGVKRHADRKRQD